MKPYSTDYRRCDACQTLISIHRPKTDPALVIDDEHDFYGKTYWDRHQGDLGYPDIQARAYSELPERCAFWLRHVLQYRCPPAKTLELGCSHGGLVYLMRLAGFDAAGLELSPWVTDFARREFGVPMFCGPAERQGFASGQFDMLLMMDVIEHLFSPLEAMRRYAEYLADDATIVLQTPRYDPAVSYEALAAADGPFLAQLKGAEHLYLFSEASLRQLLVQAGFGYTESKKAIFSQYDQFVFASRIPLRRHSSEAQTTILAELDRQSSILLQTAMEGEKRSTFLQAACDERLRVIRDLQHKVDVETLRAQQSELRCQEQEEKSGALQTQLAEQAATGSRLSDDLKAREALLEERATAEALMEKKIASIETALAEQTDAKERLAGEVRARDTLLEERAAAEALMEKKIASIKTALAEQTDAKEKLAGEVCARDTLLEERAAAGSLMEKKIAALETALADSALVRSNLESRIVGFTQRCGRYDAMIEKLSLEIRRQQDAIRLLEAGQANLQARRAFLLQRIVSLRADLRQTRSERTLAARRALRAERCVAAEAALTTHLTRARDTLAESLRAQNDTIAAEAAAMRILGERFSSTAAELARVACQREQAVTLLKDACAWRWLGASRKRTIRACLQNLGVDLRQGRYERN